MLNYRVAGAQISGPLSRVKADAVFAGTANLLPWSEEHIDAVELIRACLDLLDKALLEGGDVGGGDDFAQYRLSVAVLNHEQPLALRYKRGNNFGYSLFEELDFASRFKYRESFFTNAQMDFCFHFVAFGIIKMA